MTGSSTTGRKPQAENTIGRSFGTGPGSPSYGLSAGEGFKRQLRQADQTVVVHPGEAAHRARSDRSDRSY
jgi:hypothetical protein